MNALSASFALVREHRRSYLVLNLLYFGLVVAGMVYSANDRELQESLGTASREGVAQAVPLVADAYKEGRFLVAIALTFAINLIGGAFLSITLPSMIVPFGGLLLACTRAVVWGLIFSPSPEALALDGVGFARFVLIVVLLLLEGQGFVLAMFASWLQGRSFLWPSTVGAETRWHGYRHGLKQSLQVYLLLAMQLLIAAIYEAVLVIAILPRLA